MFEVIPYRESGHDAFAKEGGWRRRRRRIRIAAESPVAEAVAVRTQHLGTLLGPVTSAATPIALLGIAHARLLANATRRHLHLHALPVDHHTVELLDGVVDVPGRVQVHEPVVAHDVALDHGAELLEELAHFGGARLVRQVTHEYLGGRSGGRAPALGGLALDHLAVQRVPVQVLDRVAAHLLAFHVNETVIADHVAFYYRTVLFEQRPEVVRRRFFRKVPDEDFERTGTRHDRSESNTRYERQRQRQILIIKFARRIFSLFLFLSRDCGCGGGGGDGGGANSIGIYVAFRISHFAYASHSIPHTHARAHAHAHAHTHTLAHAHAHLAGAEGDKSAPASAGYSEVAVADAPVDSADCDSSLSFSFRCWLPLPSLTSAG